MSPSPSGGGVPRDLGHRLVEVLEEAQRRGFLGSGPVADHVTHAQAYGAAGAGAGGACRRPCLDLGSGGGVPGLVLAAAGPGTRWVLLEANQRRCGFLVEAVATLELGDRVDVVNARAEVVARDDAHRGSYGTVVARAFGRPAVTAECAAPLLVPGGQLFVSEPPDGQTEHRWPETALDRLGLGLVLLTPERPRLAVLQQQRPCPERYPRRVGIPGKRPLW